jgi:hypothetical protein
LVREAANAAIAQRCNDLPERIVFEGTASSLGQSILDQIYTAISSQMAAA